VNGSFYYDSMSLATDLTWDVTAPKLVTWEYST